jgi:hypothetical protein
VTESNRQDSYRRHSNFHNEEQYKWSPEELITENYDQNRKKSVNILMKSSKQKHTVKDFDIYRTVRALLMRRWI